MSNPIEVIDLGTEKEEKTYNKRMNVYIVLDNEESNKYKSMYMNKDYLEFDNPYHDHIIIPYHEINKFAVKIIKKLNAWGVFFESRFYLDLDIYKNDNVYKFEVQNTEISYIIDFLKTLSIEIIDINDSLKKYLNRRKNNE